MLLFLWLARLRERWFGKLVERSRKCHRPAARPRLYRRLEVEQLETRALLSTVLPLEPATPDYIIASPQAGISPMGGDGPAGGYTPSQIAQAYGFNQISFTSNGTTVPGNGAGQTIAIVDAYNDPNISSDLQTFDAQFGLLNPTLTVVGQTGGAAPTGTDPTGGWEVEESLDVEWAHAVAPAANIVLVEANSNSLTNLMTAVKTAANLPGVSVVSMSWGAGEFSSETSDDSAYFSTPNVPANVAFVAASGDYGPPPNYPAASPNVLAVGGTTLTLTSSNNWASETAWSGSSGGISAYEKLPSYQVAAVTNNPNIPGGTPTTRTVPDVAYDANPNTGFAVYDSFDESGWLEIGGTSDAAPQWAALIAIADQGRALNGESTLGYSQLLPDIYQMPASNFHDITSGSSISSSGGPSYSAGPGYDLVTGLGTPIANLVVDSLVDSVTTKANNVTAIYSTNPQTVALNATVTDVLNPTNVINEGTVTFTIKNGSTVIGSVQAAVSDGTASTNYTLPGGLAAGSYTIAVSFSDSSGTYGDDGDTYGTLIITPANVNTTAANLTASYSTNVQTLTLHATVADSSFPNDTVGEGTVTFTVKNGNTVIGSGQGTVSGGKASASVILPAQQPTGIYTIAVSYSDSLGNFIDNGDTNGTLTVNPDNVNTTAANFSAVYSTNVHTLTLHAAVADSSFPSDTVGEGTV
ncbi:MAG TPA: hypothetical protein VMF69_22075, partial [Gemmataceae bacterium]|nr:hypothetical protein [Gemmataceae bacterium]